MRKSKGVDEYLFDIEGLCNAPKVKLPEKLKMPHIELFDGTGNPKSHLRLYVGILHPMGIERELFALLF